MAITISTFAIAPIAIIASSLAGYICLAIGLNMFFWATGTGVFESDRRYYLYRPDEYVDAYTDPESRHWLVPGVGPGL